MNEQSVASARASVMYYDSASKKWVHSGTCSGISKVHIYHHTEHNTFRVVGRKVGNHEVVINCSILKGLKYFQATPTFHQWRDNNQIHGLNFASRGDAETFALAMERVLEILGTSSMYLSTHRSPSQSQPLYQTIGHSGVNLDDYAEYRGWVNNENTERKTNSEYGSYRSSSVSVNHSSHPTTPGSAVSPNSYSHHRSSSASSTLQQPKSLPTQQPSPQSSVPPPPPPPPPSNSTISGIATLPRLNIKPAGSELTETSLAAALASAKLKKTPTKTPEALPNESRQPSVPKGIASMLDEMNRVLVRRRAQTDSSVELESNSNGDSNRSWNKQSTLNGYSPIKNSGGESPQSLRRSDTDSENKNQIVVDVSEMDRMKQEIMSELKKEMTKMKQDIIDAIKMELNRR